ncbi:MAG: metal-sensing transcriptional repressor [Chloroflexi bacterium]|nr:metal-sensing transcriptional repressor [Chloroflexota bacterium]
MSSTSAAAERTGAVRHAQRAGGQAAALAGLIAGGAPFSEIAQQLLAARGSLDSLLVRLVDLELNECLPSQTVRDEVGHLILTALGRTGSRQSALRHRRDSTQRPTQFHIERTDS